MGTDDRGFPPGDMRVSDADRDRALGELSEAFQAGRISADEFDQRSGQALAARTGKELAAQLSDLPVLRAPVDTTDLQRPTRGVAPGVVIGAAVAATCFAAVSVTSAISRGPSLQQRELFQAFMARQGIKVPLPPASGFNWPGTIAPAVIALMLIVLIIFLRTMRTDRF